MCSHSCHKICVLFSVWLNSATQFFTNYFLVKALSVVFISYLVLNCVPLLFDVSMFQIHHFLYRIKVIKWFCKLIRHLESDFMQINRIITGTNLVIVVTMFFILCAEEVLIYPLLIVLADNFGLAYVLKLDCSLRLGLSYLLRLRRNHGLGLSYLRGFAHCYWFNSGLSNFSWWSD